MGNLTAKTSGEIASFMSPSMTNIKSLKVHFSPKQLGTGDPSPENVREIEGWNGVEGYSANENLWSNDYYTQCDNPLSLITDSEDIYYGFYTGSIASWRNSIGFIPVNNIDGKRLTISADIGAIDTFTFRFYFKYSDGTSDYISNISAKPNEIIRVSRTSTSGKKVIGYSVGTSAGVNNFRGRISNIMVSWDNEKEYIEPNTKKISINWSSEIGTVYGGYVDLISGELVEEYTYTEPNDNQWHVGTSYAYQTGHPVGVAITKTTYKKNICNYWKNNTWDNRYFLTVNESGMLVIGRTVVEETFNGDYTADGIAEIFANFKTNNSPLIVTYPLKTPIIHQLTPTQLKSFVGQNNFWSNADYVEIEYDLIETEDIQKCRKKIILNQPQLKTVSDKVVSFNTDMVAPMKNCKIYFNPIQLGSGDPSPTNVRDINGWTGLDSYVNGDKISIDWTNDAGTIYGGYLDLAKGEVVATYALFDAYQNRSLFIQGDGNVYIANNQFATYGFVKPINTNKSISTHFKAVNITTENYPSFSVSNIGHFALRGIPNVTDTVEHFTTYIEEQMNNNTPVQFVMPLVTPIIYQLTPQQLLTLKSTNHIWSETNGQQIDVTYWTRKNLTPTPLVNYLENQTWTDSAYISSSGKKTTNTVSASHFLTNQILLEAGTYVLSGFSYYVGTDNTNYRIHAYDSTGKWLRQITFQQIGNLSPVDISFTLDTDTYVNVSIAMDFDGVLAKIN